MKHGCISSLVVMIHIIFIFFHLYCKDWISFLGSGAQEPKSLYTILQRQFTSMVLKKKKKIFIYLGILSGFSQRSVS